MKKKPLSEPIIAPQILAMAKKSVDAERPSTSKPCIVCGASCKEPVGPPHQDSDGDLCWICRRLKISAWRDSDQQLSAQE
ncbi:MAG: hypothetical protein JO210_00765 [Acidobacteriaceae bacterium]|nr:hypothetical protein [Acidobacteriaceae bacterium]